ncbi:P-loop NTPase family protein, partial [Staphylococcus epidermidis]
IRKFKKEDIGYIYENYGLLENKRVLGNVMLGLNICKKDMGKIMEIIECVGLGKEIVKGKVYSCSGGEEEGIGIGRGIVKNGRVIFGDEGRGNLDEKNAD